jgi:hypothetical protein
MKKQLKAQTIEGGGDVLIIILSKEQADKSKSTSAK